MTCLNCKKNLEPLKSGWKYNPFAILCTCQTIIYYELAEINPVSFSVKYCVRPTGSKLFPVH